MVSTPRCCAAAEAGVINAATHNNTMTINGCLLIGQVNDELLRGCGPAAPTGSGIAHSRRRQPSTRCRSGPTPCPGYSPGQRVRGPAGRPHRRSDEGMASAGFKGDGRARRERIWRVGDEAVIQVIQMGISIVAILWKDN